MLSLSVHTNKSASASGRPQSSRNHTFWTPHMQITGAQMPGESVQQQRPFNIICCKVQTVCI